jgi:predicted house-cleaning noncanonical NTP pyrophosphatase (MazG superfamily)/chloramphenicol 3-O-phosphotransferase
MSKVIIINGPSCAGKTTIAKEICRQSDNKFVHLQIDKAGEFYSTIFPKGFVFAENEIGTENNDDGLKGLFNNNRLARRKVVASILLATAKELLKQNFNIVIDTALDGPDAKELAEMYLEYLDGYEIIFVGIYCHVEERLKRLKTRKDNLFLTENFIRNQTDQYDVFESCKEFYNIWFDSSLLNGEEIAERILEHNQNAQQGKVPQFFVRTSQLSDIDAMVLLSKAKRKLYEKAQPHFWRYAGEEGDNTQTQRFKVDKLIRDKIPDIIRASAGIDLSTRIMEQDEYLQRLKDKLLEESKEVIASGSEKEMREELADVLEVMLSLAKAYGMEFADIQQAAEQKRADKGGFDNKILLLGTKL